ncbi:MAG: NAD(P)-dependent oxidoreductase [Candidatus Acidiferrales bacterium]|jgi:D-lactate dehydrogenase
MKAILFEVKDPERAYIEERLRGWTLYFAAVGTDPLDAAAEHADAECFSVFIRPPLTEKTLAGFPALKLIATRSTGYDHIDLDACRKRGIAVTNVPSYGENTVAEHTFALILMLSRKVHQSYNQVRAGNVERAMLTGFDLQGKTLGVIGAGRIGLHAIRIGRGFGMRVLAYDTRQDHFLADLLGFQYVRLETLLEESDIVSLHCPLLPATRHLIGREQLQRMKKGALLVNTARGGLVDTDALVDALESGKLSGAGLDVVEGEEFIQEEHQLLEKPQSIETLRAAVRNRVLLARDDVVFTPHNAFNSREAMQRILDTTIENLEAYRAGKLINRVA